MVEAKYDPMTDELTARLKGDIDIYAAPELKEKLALMIEEHKSDIVIDCSDLNYIDSTGLGALVALLKKAKDYDKGIRIINTKPYIRKLFTITGLEKIFSMEGEAK
ncbi:MAG: STAS domain-containing protein [Clostridiales bacterium]|jgi:anti-sigma B factor antagonist|nr:STAS domain-containing protein [Clostridiales bacterium]